MFIKTYKNFKSFIESYRNVFYSVSLIFNPIQLIQYNENIKRKDFFYMFFFRTAAFLSSFLKRIFFLFSPRFFLPLPLTRKRFREK